MTPYIVLVSAHPALISILKPVARFAGALQPVTVGIIKSAQSVWACIQCWQNVAYEPCKVSCCLDLFSATSFSSQFTRNTETPVTFHQAVIFAPAHTTNMYIWGICILWHPMAVIFGASPSFLQDLWGKPGWPGCCPCWKLDLAGPGCLHLLVHFLNRLSIRPRHPIGCEGCTSAQNYRSKANLWPIGACPWCDLQENQQLAQKISIQSIHIYINNTSVQQIKWNGLISVRLSEAKTWWDADKRQWANGSVWKMKVWSAAAFTTIARWIMCRTAALKW